MNVRDDVSNETVTGQLCGGGRAQNDHAVEHGKEKMGERSVEEVVEGGKGRNGLCKPESFQKTVAREQLEKGCSCGSRLRHLWCSTICSFGMRNITKTAG